ncbi:MAG TPA: zinc-binding dehydrogenase [Verrucomicrobiae bacterium]|nr:zinc-binding dehydrogenase [Verrucomicrobiae bacterium]
MKAVQLLAHGTPGKFRHGDVPDPIAADNEVLVTVRVCGLNHLDLWLEEGQIPVAITLPRIPGGEISGEIAAVGRGVSGWREGDRVAIQSNLFCGECEFCRRGRESICLKGQLLGVQRDGGFAEKVSVPARALVRIPDRVDFATSAALTLAGSTAMHMLTDRVAVKPGDWVLAIGGAGGVGSAAIQVARGLGARVITTGSSETKRKFGLALGAEHAVDSNNPDWPAHVRELTGKRGADVVVEHVGGEVLLQCISCLARGGSIVTCGATAGREIPLKLWPLFVKEQSLIGSYGRNRKDIEATLDWAAAGKIKATIWKAFPLSETPAAFAALRQRDVIGKVIISP